MIFYLSGYIYCNSLNSNIIYKRFENNLYTGFTFVINDYFTKNLKGDCLLAVGDEDLVKIHFHTNEPWKVLEYCASLGEIYDIVIEDMDRQARGMQG